MKAIFNQFRGLGDILFTIPIARHLLKNGYDEVMYPTIFTGIDKHFPDIKFVEKNKLSINYDKKEIYDYNGYIVFPLRWTDQILKAKYTSCMLTKYRYFNLPVKMWRGLDWVRDKYSENKLFYDILRLNDNDKYNLINNNFLSDFSGKTNISKSSDIKNVIMKEIKPFTMLDWCKVIENASSISLVGSSMLLLLELLNLKTNQVNVYPRIPHENHHYNYDYICTKNFNYL